MDRWGEREGGMELPQRPRRRRRKREGERGSLWLKKIKKGGREKKRQRGVEEEGTSGEQTDSYRHAIGLGQRTA